MPSTKFKECFARVLSLLCTWRHDDVITTWLTFLALTLKCPVPHPPRDPASIRGTLSSVECLVDRQSVQNDCVVKSSNEAVHLETVQQRNSCTGYRNNCIIRLWALAFQPTIISLLLLLRSVKVSSRCISRNRSARRSLWTNLIRVEISILSTLSRAITIVTASLPRWFVHCQRLI